MNTPSVPIYLSLWLWTRRLRRGEKGGCTENSEERDRDVLDYRIRLVFVDKFRSFVVGDFDRPPSSNIALSSSPTVSFSFSKLESE
jgi:hypothetical protein